MYLRTPYDPAGVSENPRWPNADDVIISWAIPDGVNLDPAKDPPTVYVKYSNTEEGDVFASYEMTLVGDEYRCTLPAQLHDTWCGWYVKAHVLGISDPVYDPQVPGGQPTLRFAERQS